MQMLGVPPVVRLMASHLLGVLRSPLSRQVWSVDEEPSLCRGGRAPGPLRKTRSALLAVSGTLDFGGRRSGQDVPSASRRLFLGLVPHAGLRVHSARSSRRPRGSRARRRGEVPAPRVGGSAAASCRTLHPAFEAFRSDPKGPQAHLRHFFAGPRNGVPHLPRSCFCSFY